MAMAHAGHLEECKAEIVRLVREDGRTPCELAREFEPSTQSIVNWVALPENNTGVRQGLTSDEKAELKRLRSEGRVLPMEKDLLEKNSGLQRSREGRFLDQVHMRTARRDPLRLLCVAQTTAMPTPHRGRCVHSGAQTDPHRSAMHV